MLADYTLAKQRMFVGRAKRLMEEGLVAEEIAKRLGIDDATAREICYIVEHGQKRGRYKMEK